MNRFFSRFSLAVVTIAFVICGITLIVSDADASREDVRQISLRKSKATIFVEAISSGVLKIWSELGSGVSKRILFEGRVQSISLPDGLSPNAEVKEFLAERGHYTLSATAGERTDDVIVILSEGKVLIYDGETAHLRKMPLPIPSMIRPENLRLVSFQIEWLPSHPQYTFFSFGIVNHSPQASGALSGTYIARRVQQKGPDGDIFSFRQIEEGDSRNIRAINLGHEIEVSYQLTGDGTRKTFRIPDTPGPNPMYPLLTYDPDIGNDDVVDEDAERDARRRAVSEQNKDIAHRRTTLTLNKDSSTQANGVSWIEERDVAIETPEGSEVRRPSMDFKTYLRAFAKELNRVVLGQPEGVDLLLDIEKQNILNNGKRIAPEIGVFTGLPGTGKDTLVESYIRTRLDVAHALQGESIDNHIFRAPVAKSEKDIWSFTGSGTGYVGSGKISALNRFLIQHSGGRYQIKSTPGPRGDEYVVENPDWKPGQVLENYFAPEDGALFINEFHDWSLVAKNTILKEAIEKGYFTIGDPGQGLNRIQVPINIFIASNDGIGLITARDREGRRFGSPLTEAQMLERWELNSKDKATLKKELSQPSTSNPDGGTSEEVLSRIPNSRVILLRPLAKQTILKIAKLKLEGLRDKLLKDKARGFPNVNLQFSPKLIEFLASYDQMSEEGARPIDDKIKSLIEKTLSDALFSGKIEFEPGTQVLLSIQKNSDNTYSLVVGPKRFLISYTEKNRNSLPITDEQIDRLGKLETALNARVKGVEHIVKALVRDIRRSENSEKASLPDLETKLADVYAFLGTSSTGKTELATVLHQVLFQTNSKPLVIDFNQIQSVRDLKEKILGFRDSMNKAIASDFMQEYDRTNGRLVLVLDEISNANPEVLKGLYDILREPVVRTFSDGKARPMGQVRIVMTGNAGEEWYQGIPREAPEAEQLEAARQIYEQSIANEGFLRKFLMTKFSEAFLNRIGLHRIFFFGPHTAGNTRALIQLRLIKSFQEFSEERPGRRSWNLRFESKEDYVKTIESIENYGFKLWEQGASITNFIGQVMMNEIHDILLTEKVGAGSEVFVRKIEDKKLRDSTDVNFELVVKPNPKDKNQTLGAERVLSLTVKGRPVVRTTRRDPKATMLTAFHEAGHEVVNKVLLGDKIRSDGISILPGVTEIGGKWIRYAGVARQQNIEEMTPTREVIISRIAVLLGGEAGEVLSTKNSRHSAGISNDIERAAALARTAVLSWGLSEKWGVTSLGGQELDKFVVGLSEERRKILEEEVHTLLEEGRKLARSVLMANFDAIFNPVAMHLAKKGEVSGEALERFYQKNEREIVRATEFEVVQARLAEYEARKASEAPAKELRDFEFYSFARTPETIADPEVIRKVNLARELSTVDLSPGEAITGPTRSIQAQKKTQPQKDVMAKAQAIKSATGAATLAPMSCEMSFVHVSN